MEREFVVGRTVFVHDCQRGQKTGTVPEMRSIRGCGKVVRTVATLR